MTSPRPSFSLKPGYTRKGILCELPKVLRGIPVQIFSAYCSGRLKPATGEGSKKYSNLQKAIAASILEIAFATLIAS